MTESINRVGCTMCHGVWADEVEKPVIPNWTALTRSSFERKIGILRAAGVASIGYDELEQWWNGRRLAGPSVLIDFDHPVLSIIREVHPILSRYGFAGNLFVDTARIDNDSEKPANERKCMRWQDIGRLHESGWTIGAHTVHHYSLDRVEAEDPSGARMLDEMAGADERIQAELGITPRDFAYTGLGWSPMAERIASERYRFARLWITGAMYNDPAGNQISIGSLLGCDGPDEADGGPHYECRYITRETNPHRLPSMEMENLIASDDAFGRYVDGLREVDA